MLSMALALVRKKTTGCLSFYCDALHLFFLSELSNHVELMKDKDRLVFRAKRCTYIVRCILSMYLKHKFRLFI